MTNPHDLAAHLPPRLDDEPAHLRSDIVDELSDHLQCARTRELLADANCPEDELWSRVEKRFGDPATVASTLWREALWKGQIMQKLLIAACVLLVVVCVGSVAVSLTALHRQQALFRDLQAQSRDELESQRHQFADFAARANATEDAMRAELQAARDDAERERRQADDRLKQLEGNLRQNSDWNPVEFLFVADTTEGAPVPGVQVTLTITARETGIPSSRAVSNDDGRVRFERVRYGRYALRLTAPTGETSFSELELQPGEGLQRTIICPTRPLRNLPVQPQIVWPADVPAERLLCLLPQDDLVHPLDGTVWSSSSRSAQLRGDRGARMGSWQLMNPRHQYAATGSPGDLANFLRTRGGFTESRPSLSVTGSIDERVREFSLRRIRLFPASAQADWMPLNWPGEGYQFAQIEIINRQIPRGNTALQQLWQRLSDGRISSPFPVTQDVPEGGVTEVSADLVTVAGSSFQYRLDESSAPATLWLEPDAETIEAIRTALSDFDALSENFAVPSRGNESNRAPE